MAQSINVDYHELKMSQNTSEKQWGFDVSDWVFINPYPGDLNEHLIYKR